MFRQTINLSGVMVNQVPYLSDRFPFLLLAFPKGLSLYQLYFLLIVYIILFGLVKLNFEFGDLLLISPLIIILQLGYLVFHIGTKDTTRCQTTFCSTKCFKRHSSLVDLCRECARKSTMRIGQPAKTIRHCSAKINDGIDS